MDEEERMTGDYKKGERNLGVDGEPGDETCLLVMIIKMEDEEKGEKRKGNGP